MHLPLLRVRRLPAFHLQMTGIDAAALASWPRSNRTLRTVQTAKASAYRPERFCTQTAVWALYMVFVRSQFGVRQRRTGVCRHAKNESMTRKNESVGVKDR